MACFQFAKKWRLHAAILCTRDKEYTMAVTMLAHPRLEKLCTPCICTMLNSTR